MRPLFFTATQRNGPTYSLSHIFDVVVSMLVFHLCRLSSHYIIITKASTHSSPGILLFHRSKCILYAYDSYCKMRFFFSLPHNSTYTPIGMTLTLVGQNLAGWAAIGLSPCILGLFLSLSLYTGACMSETSMHFNELNAICNANIVNKNAFQSVLLDLLKHHNWTIK